MSWLGRHWTVVLLAGVPVAALLEFFAPERHTALFIASTIAIVPLAAFIGRATDDLSNRLGGGIGGLLNATFGNAAEHFSAVLMTSRNQMDAAISIAVGSSTQIALFVAPVLVFLSYAIAPQPMDLLFTVFEVVAVGLAVLTISLIAHDGETHWMEGVQLVAVYTILALGFYFLPSPSTP
jgi:Ca2+:H+ antiporter